jgi:hypothetical protein
VGTVINAVFLQTGKTGKFQIFISEEEDIKLGRNTVNFVPDGTYQKKLFSKCLVFHKNTSVCRGKKCFILLF